MSKVATLEDAVLDLGVIREAAKNDLLDLLAKFDEPVCLVVDTLVAATLNHILIAGPRQLSEGGVGEIRELSWDSLQTSRRDVVFLVRPVISAMRQVAAQMKQTTAREGVKPKYHLYFVPRRTLICEEVLRTEKVMDDLTIGEYDLELVPFDSDLLSLEYPMSFKECNIDGDRTSLQVVAKSIIKLQGFYGTIPNVKAKGSAAKSTWQMVQKYMKDFPGLIDDSAPPQIDTLVLIDRRVDLITPLLTPLTYEGLVDDLIGIENGYIKVDPELLTGNDPAGPDGATDAKSTSESDGDGKRSSEKVALALNSNDKLFSDIRDFNVESLGHYLQQKAQQIRDQYESFRSNRSATLQELSEFVHDLPELKQHYKSLQAHIGIVEKIKQTTDTSEFRSQWMLERSMLEGEQEYDKLEEKVALQESLLKVLRVICLQSMTGGGLKQKYFDSIRREILHSYGFELLLTLNNLEKLGLLRRRESSWSMDSHNTWNNLKRGLRLIKGEVNVMDPDDIAYVTSGYAPLTGRLIEMATQDLWASSQDIMRQLSGPTMELTQESPKAILSPRRAGRRPERKKMVVYFVGGITYMEIAAIRHIAHQHECPFDILIATTNITNGDLFVQSLIEPMHRTQSSQKR